MRRALASSLVLLNGSPLFGVQGFLAPLVANHLTRSTASLHSRFLPSLLPATVQESSGTATTSTITASNASDDTRIARVVLVAGSAPSGYGATSPEPNPSWTAVATQLAHRLPHFAPTGKDDSSSLIETRALASTDVTPEDLRQADVVVALGVTPGVEQAALAAALSAADQCAAFVADPTCSTEILQLQKAGDYTVASTWQDAVAQLLPWTSWASGKRLLAKTNTLLARKSSEDYIFAMLFCIHALVREIDVVKSDINPSWEKGVVRNAQEFAKMCRCCGTEIAAALTDPQSKQAIDLLNSCDLRDQVGSYRVIVSNETPQLEAFTRCILQQNNCFGCDAPILTSPRVPLIEKWRGKPVDETAARQIWIGHLDDPAAADCSQKQDWSWKIVVGANPAYDAFPMQHQVFYPSGGSGKSLWYDPTFCVESLQGSLIWCKRHYRCTPRKHWSGRSEGAWTLSTLDNGMVSEEHWTTVDAADDLSWCVLHYTGAARRAGQSYVGALLCTPDGQWPENCQSGKGLERIRQAFRNCDLELWELFGGSTVKSFMWSEKFTSWAAENPPPLERIGDISITKWRESQGKE